MPSDFLSDPALLELGGSMGGGGIAGALALYGLQQLRMRFLGRAKADDRKGPLAPLEDVSELLSQVGRIESQVGELHALLTREDPASGLRLGDPRTIRAAHRGLAQDHLALREALGEILSALRALSASKAE